VQSVRRVRVTVRERVCVLKDGLPVPVHVHMRCNNHTATRHTLFMDATFSPKSLIFALLLSWRICSVPSDVDAGERSQQGKQTETRERHTHTHTARKSENFKECNKQREECVRACVYVRAYKPSPPTPYDVGVLEAPADKLLQAGSLQERIRGDHTRWQTKEMRCVTYSVLTEKRTLAHT
jgi:hypothetical protein